MSRVGHSIETYKKRQIYEDPRNYQPNEHDGVLNIDMDNMGFSEVETGHLISPT